MIKYIPILALIMGACDTMDEVYDELDNKKLPYSEKIEYTLIDGDYTLARNIAYKDALNSTDSALAKAIATNLAFNQKYTAEDYMYSVLGYRFMALDKGSSAKVTYNTIDKPAEIALFEDAPEYVLEKTDYAILHDSIVSYSFFMPDFPVSENISPVLDSTFTDAVEGDVVLITCNTTQTNPWDATPKTVTVFSEDFEIYANKDTINKNGWTRFVESDSIVWLARTYNNNDYAQASAFGAKGVVSTWLISPSIDLNNTKNNKLSFEINVGYYTHNGFQVLIAEDLTPGEVADASWVDVTSYFTIPEEPVSGYGVLTPAGSFDLSIFTGPINIAFKYTGDGASGLTTTYQFDNVMVKGKGYENYPTNYLFVKEASAWEIVENSFVLSPADYEDMGITKFSSSILPSNYIPQLLSQKFPFVQEGKIQRVMYNFEFNKETSKRMADYTFTGGEWITNTNGAIISLTKQFVHNGTSWFFDPTIKLTPGAADLQLLVDYVYTNLSRTYGSSYGNDEFYFGASAYYVNFDLRLSNKSTYSIPGYDELTSDEEKIALTWQRVEEGLSILLGLKYPDAVSQVSGIPVYYWVTFKTYENDLSKNTYTGIFQFTDQGVFERITEVEDEKVTEGELTSEAVGWNR